MNRQPLISVVIPTYNCGRFVVSAVKSVFAQTYAPLELIVVDDGSTDDTRDRLVPWKGQIRYVCYQTNKGLSKARNTGIKEARGDLIAFLDADDEWLPQKLEKQLEQLNNVPSAQLVHTDLYYFNERTGQRIYTCRRRDRFSGYCYTEFFWGNAVVPSTVIVTRRCLAKVGVFDEAIRGASTQDMDLWMRIARHYELAYVNEPVVLYRHHTANASRNQRMMLEDEYYVLAKALQSEPTLLKSLRTRRLTRRMSDLAFQAGYANADLGDLARARRYFVAALRYEPWKVRTWAMWASTFLPCKLRHELRQLKQRVFPVEHSEYAQVAS